MKVPMHYRELNEKIEKVIKLCEEEGISIAIEDPSMGFVITNIEPLNYQWLRKAKNEVLVNETGGYGNSPELKVTSDIHPPTT